MNKNNGSKKKHPIPPSLQKMGITSVTDNIPEGYQLVISGAAFNTFFGDAIQEFIKMKRKQ
ncbi:MAG: hypothetical protein OEW89_00740 [Gammaproteobacteria bacterium]|nr:hypothetical protein [Gammaproteobacteria bacterium]MDH5593295.1 hypothetical protein [Gammaproteobacteria bacterium]